MNQTSEYPGPLVGLNVIDFGHYYAGPAAAMLLADQGANVIRIAKPGEPELRQQQYRLINRNKKLLTLDLKTEEGKEQALSLIEHADVVIENFRPGVMKRLGLDYASIKSNNPGLIYLSLPGFASNDKARSHIQAWEGILSAAAGIYVDYLGIRKVLGYPPLYTSIPHCSMFGSVHGATAVMAALLARRQHGWGTVLEVPLIDAGMSGLSDGFTSRVGWKCVAGSTASGNELPPDLEPYRYSETDSSVTQAEKLGRAEQSLCPPVVKNYPSADGRKYAFWGAVSINLAEDFYRALGIDKQLKHEGYVNVGPWDFELGNNLSNAFNPMAPDRTKRLEQLMAEAFENSPAEEWEPRMHRCVAGTVRTREEWMNLEPVLKSGLLTKISNGQSELTVPGRAVDVSGPEGALIGEYREAVPVTFNEASQLFEETVKARPTQPGKPAGERPVARKGDLLRGLKILDLANVMAGPMSGYVLGQYGAQVITGTSIVNFPANQENVLEANMGKRSILTDVTTAPGREILQRLIARSDVVLHNILDHTAKRMGVTHAQVQVINPDAVSCQVSAFGGTLRGGWERRQGVDMSVQTETGLAAQYGSLEWPQRVGMAAGCDCMTGQTAAFAMLLGVWQQRETGIAGEVRTSLARANQFFQLPWMIMENGRCDWGEAQGQAAVGEQGWQRIYKCKDSWIYVGTSDDRAGQLVEVVLKEQSSVWRDTDEQALEAAFAERDCTYWLDKLNAANIACHRVMSLDDHCKKTREVDNEPAHEQATGAAEILCWADHPSGIPVRLPAPSWVRVGEGHFYFRCASAPRRGQHTVEILRELGYSEEEIKELIEVRVSYEYMPEIGNKDDYFFRIPKP